MANPTIQILPYIQNDKSVHNSTKDKPDKKVTNSDASFSEHFEAAKRATAALAIDALVLASEKRAVDPNEVQSYFNSKNINIRIPNASINNDSTAHNINGIPNTNTLPPVSTDSTNETDSTPGTTPTGSVNSSTDALKCPETLDEYFLEASNLYGVDVKLLKSVAKVESNFDSSATSSVGAMGIMQLMPNTAKELDVELPYDARENILGGAKLLARFLEKYNGNIELTLSAYNAGPGAVAKYNGEIVPSTRGYVDKVLSYYYS